jgi:hypothetical protein
MTLSRGPERRAISSRAFSGRSEKPTDAMGDLCEKLACRFCVRVCRACGSFLKYQIGAKDLDFGLDDSCLYR